MASRLIRPITDAEVDAFETTGAVCLRGMFDAGWVARMREAMDRVLADPGPIHIEAAADGGRLAVETYVWRRDAAFRDYAFASPASAIAARLLRAEKVNLLFDQMLVKEPMTPTPTSWHQDGPNWPIHGTQALSLWMALDDVDQQSGAMRYASGSHEGPAYASSTNFVRHIRPDAKNTSGDPCPDFDAIENGPEVIGWDVQPGDVLAHHMWTAHAANGNLSPDRRRRAHTTRWAGETARFQTGYYKLRMPFTPTLADGDPLDSEHFPAVPFERDWELVEQV
ncbi:phytanoyl-CoA dioxygenase family protein [Sphingomonas colocasiae]|uniref:Phytanoyl-CoA dioxygenase family protein n=1 Tax=Sphingomonas colocasiae TaxID=1848973 RepID=A0ABS7PSR1_9SPHN|nr:phytanoyl-CoA dioxygenase family protein [Sphingomonas colocasiae]MBY8824382.1 phytanoyl-CoA dioxygenase family protein [Sphingomonas colocasiae]